MSKSIPYNEAAHLVIDIETFGTNDDAVILELAGITVVPDENKHLKTDGYADYVFDIEHQMNVLNRKVESGTLAWWLEKGSMLQSMFTDAENSSKLFKPCYLQLAEAVRQLRDDFPAVYFWSRGTDFDFRIIKNIAQQLNLEPFWKFWEVRDIRTISNPLLLPNEFVTSNNHRALDDAYNEATELVHVVNRLVDLSK